MKKLILSFCVLLLFVTGCAPVVKNEEIQEEKKEVSTQEEIVEGVVTYSTGNYALTSMDEFAKEILVNKLDIEENYQDSAFREKIKKGIDNDVFERADDEFKEEIGKLIYNEDNHDYVLKEDIIIQTSQFVNNVMYMFRGSYVSPDDNFKSFTNNPEFIVFSLDSPVFYVAPQEYQKTYEMTVDGDMVTSSIDNSTVKVDQRINFYYQLSQTGLPFSNALPIQGANVYGNYEDGVIIDYTYVEKVGEGLFQQANITSLIEFDDSKNISSIIQVKHISTKSEDESNPVEIIEDEYLEIHYK